MGTKAPTTAATTTKAPTTAAPTTKAGTTTATTKPTTAGGSRRLNTGLATGPLLIYSVGLGNDIRKQAQDILKKVAEDNNGAYTQVPDGSSLSRLRSAMATFYESPYLQRKTSGNDPKSNIVLSSPYLVSSGAGGISTTLAASVRHQGK